MENNDREKNNYLKEIEEDIEKKFEIFINSKKQEKLDESYFEPTEEKDILKKKIDDEKEFNKEPSEKNIVKKKRLKVGYKSGKHLVSNYFDEFKKLVDKVEKIGEPVFLEETGERIGIISEKKYDEGEKLIGFKIKDEDTNAEYELPVDYFYHDKKGVILTPKWYVDTSNKIKEIEFVERIQPEFKDLFDDNGFDDELFNMIVEQDGGAYKHLKEAKRIYANLEKQIRILEKKRLDLKEKVWELTTNRLIEDVDRKDYSDKIKDIRNKANILNLKIEKCRNLIKDLDKTSIGKISKNIDRKSERKNQNKLEKKDVLLDKLFAEIIEDRIIKDIKKHLIKNTESDKKIDYKDLFDKE